MTFSGFFDFRIVRAGGKKVVTPIEAIGFLMDEGWSFCRNGYVRYLPIGDQDNTTWTREILTMDSLLKIVAEKESQAELIGVAMTWQDTDIGGELLMSGELETKEKKIHSPIKFSVAAHRNKFLSKEDYPITDVNWYLERLLLAFDRDDVYVEFYTYEEHV